MVSITLPLALKSNDLAIGRWRGFWMVKNYKATITICLAKTVKMSNFNPSCSILHNKASSIFSSKIQWANSTNILLVVSEFVPKSACGPTSWRAVLSKQMRRRVFGGSYLGQVRWRACKARLCNIVQLLVETSTCHSVQKLRGGRSCPALH